MRMDHRVRSRFAGRFGAVVEGEVVEPVAKDAAEAPVRSTRDRLVDINTAPADRLKSLSGIGVCYAKKIVAGRPYDSADELRTRGILPQHIYARLTHRLGTGQS